MPMLTRGRTGWVHPTLGTGVPSDEVGVNYYPRLPQPRSYVRETVAFSGLGQATAMDSTELALVKEAERHKDVFLTTTKIHHNLVQSDKQQSAVEATNIARATGMQKTLLMSSYAAAKKARAKDIAEAKAVAVHAQAEATKAEKALKAYREKALKDKRITPTQALALWKQKVCELEKATGNKLSSYQLGMISVEILDAVTKSGFDVGSAIGGIMLAANIGQLEKDYRRRGGALCIAVSTPSGPAIPPANPVENAGNQLDQDSSDEMTTALLVSGGLIAAALLITALT